MRLLISSGSIAMRALLQSPGGLVEQRPTTLVGTCPTRTIAPVGAECVDVGIVPGIPHHGRADKGVAAAHASAAYWCLRIGSS